MKQNYAVLFVSALVLIFSTFTVISAEESQSEVKAESVDVKSVAWYVANIRVAKEKNQACHDNPQINPSEDCNNALHALQISFNGAN